MRPDFIPVGAVVNAHGIRGEVKVNPAGFDPEFIASFKTLYIGGQPVSYTHLASTGAFQEVFYAAYGKTL